MPGRISLAPRERDLNLTDVGKVGRRTGTILAPQRLDEYGMEEISGMFSSPRKPSPVKHSNFTIMQSVEEVVTPKASGTSAPSSSVRQSTRGKMPPPRSISPRKSGIKGSAKRRGTLDIEDELQDEREDIRPAEQQFKHIETTPKGFKSAHAKSHAATERRATMRFSPDKTPLKSRALRVSKSAHPLRQSDISESVLNTTIALSSPAQPQDTPSHVQTNLTQTEILPEEDNFNPIAEDEQDKAAPPLPDLASDAGSISDLDPGFVSNFEPQLDLTVKKTSPAQANQRRKRKSDALEDFEPQISPPAKRTRQSPRQASSPVQEISESELRQDPPSKPKGRPAKSSPTKVKKPAKSSAKQVPLNTVSPPSRYDRAGSQSRNTQIQRRETPFDALTTRSRAGRVCIKPLAYWRNESCVYQESDSPATSKGNKSAFPLCSIREVIRVDDVAPTVIKRAKTHNGQKYKSKPSKTKTPDDDSDSDSNASANGDPEADYWELDSGTLSLPVLEWSQKDQAPTADLFTTQIAQSSSFIQSRRQSGKGGFEYAKLLTQDFFGAGVLKLSPGTMKTTKNSQRMSMCFFVVSGRVRVEVGPGNSGKRKKKDQVREKGFSVGKGGVWIVPRGNQYAIKNESEAKTARLFFAQACEPVPVEEDSDDDEEEEEEEERRGIHAHDSRLRAVRRWVSSVAR